MNKKQLAKQIFNHPMMKVLRESKDVDNKVLVKILAEEVMRESEINEGPADTLRRVLSDKLKAAASEEERENILTNFFTALQSGDEAKFVELMPRFGSKREEDKKAFYDAGKRYQTTTGPHEKLVQSIIQAQSKEEVGDAADKLISNVEEETGIEADTPDGTPDGTENTEEPPEETVPSGPKYIEPTKAEKEAHRQIYGDEWNRRTDWVKKIEQSMENNTFLNPVVSGSDDASAQFRAMMAEKMSVASFLAYVKVFSNKELQEDINDVFTKAGEKQETVKTAWSRTEISQRNSILAFMDRDTRNKEWLANEVVKITSSTISPEKAEEILNKFLDIVAQVLKGSSLQEQEVEDREFGKHIMKFLEAAGVNSEQVEQIKTKLGEVELNLRDVDQALAVEGAIQKALDGLNQRRAPTEPADQTAPQNMPRQELERENLKAISVQLNDFFSDTPLKSFMFQYTLRRQGESLRNNLLAPLAKIIKGPPFDSMEMRAYTDVLPTDDTQQPTAPEEPDEPEGTETPEETEPGSLQEQSIADRIYNLGQAGGPVNLDLSPQAARLRSQEQPEEQEPEQPEQNLEDSDEVEIKPEATVSLKREIRAARDAVRDVIEILKRYRDFATSQSINSRFNGTKIKEELDTSLQAVQKTLARIIKMAEIALEDGARPAPQELQEQPEVQRSERVQLVRDTYNQLRSEFESSLKVSLENYVSAAEDNKDEEMGKAQTVARNMLRILDDSGIVSYFPRVARFDANTGEVVTLGNAYESLVEAVKPLSKVIRDIYLVIDDGTIVIRNIRRAITQMSIISNKIAENFPDAPSLINVEVLQNIGVDTEESLTDETLPADSLPPAEVEAEFVDDDEEQPDQQELGLPPDDENSLAVLKQSTNIRYPNLLARVEERLESFGFGGGPDAPLSGTAMTKTAMAVILLVVAEQSAARSLQEQNVSKRFEQFIKDVKNQRSNDFRTLALSMGTSPDNLSLALQALPDVIDIDPGSGKISTVTKEFTEALKTILNLVKKKPEFFTTNKFLPIMKELKILTMDGQEIDPLLGQPPALDKPTQAQDPDKPERQRRTAATLDDLPPPFPMDDSFLEEQLIKKLIPIVESMLKDYHG